MRIPSATYRIQFNSVFDFQAAQSLVPYWADLGVSDIYASPIFKARKGSLHGYDVVDPTQLNPELGTTEDFHRLIEQVQTHGMGWLQDVVPNHMAFDDENQLLMDVLENGPSSEYFNFFDIAWDHPYESMRGRLLAPFLSGFYGDALENGEIQLRYDAGGLTVNFYDFKFPLRIESYATVFAHKLNSLRRRLSEDHPDFIKLLGILYVLKTLQPDEEAHERSSQIKFIKRILWELYTRNQEIRRFVDENLEIFNGHKGNPESFNPLDSLLSEQLFRLCFWKVAAEEVNYRRFFNINELISLRMEDEPVFNYTHAAMFKLIEQGKITGLRIDHIDGLYDPTVYLNRVRERAGGTYVTVEKILDFDEELPSLWPIQGTTGYDFLNYVNGIFCDQRNERKFDRLYSAFTGLRVQYEDLVSEKKRLIIGRYMAGDVDNLAHLLKNISSRDRYGGDITLYGLKRALVEALTLFPVYRTYINYEVVSQTDRLYISRAMSRAKEKNPGLLHELDFIERFLLLKFEDYFTEEEKRKWIHFVMRFQQFTGPLMAKGCEDTTLYVYNRLLSLNEVGGNPNTFGISPLEFHRFNKKRVQRWPHAMSATSTHDTKRGEDVRARINVLSEIPQEWDNNLKTWNKINRTKRKLVDNVNVPDRNDEYFLYQTLIGAFPFCGSEYPAFIERMKSYIIKAVREAKVHTAWLKPDTEYEQAFTAFVDEILNPSEQNQFLKVFRPFQKKVAYYGIFNSLSQTLIKITAPGVPDFYQGAELWDLTLVDPDNRRPVDFETRKAKLPEIKEKVGRNTLELINELLSTKEDGRIKLFLIHRALMARTERPELFGEGSYHPIQVGGALKNHVIAFARNRGDSWAVTIAPRFLTSVIEEGAAPVGPQVWSGTYISLAKNASRFWTDAITGQSLNAENTLLIGEALTHFPGALLVNEEET
jgi:(1->4)-alpha-D-glucan 1-alpha-D-glucosylmutase